MNEAGGWSSKCGLVGLWKHLTFFVTFLNVWCEWVWEQAMRIKRNQMTEMRPEWWKAEEMGTLWWFVEGWSQSILHPSALEEHICRTWYPGEVTRDGGKKSTLGFVELGKEFPGLSTGWKDLHVSKGGGNFGRSSPCWVCVVCMVECGLVGVMGRICRILEKIMRA